MNGREGEWGLDRGRLRWLGSRAYAGSEKAISLRSYYWYMKMVYLQLIDTCINWDLIFGAQTYTKFNFIIKINLRHVSWDLNII